MNVKPSFGIRAQIIVLAVVPLVFLVATLLLVMVLARNSERSAILSQRVAQILAQSDKLSLNIGMQSRSLGAYAKSHKTKDLDEYDAAVRDLPGKKGALDDLVREPHSRNRPGVTSRPSMRSSRSLRRRIATWSLAATTTSAV